MVGRRDVWIDSPTRELNRKICCCWQSGGQNLDEMDCRGIGCQGVLVVYRMSRDVVDP